MHTGHISYVDKQQPVTFPTAEPIELVLEADTSEIGEVVILGEKPITSITDEGYLRVISRQYDHNL